MSISRAKDPQWEGSSTKGSVNPSPKRVESDPHIVHDELAAQPDLLNTQFNFTQNRLSKYRSELREYAAEFLGVMVLVIFGTGVNCQVTLSSITAVAASPKGNYLSVSFGWAIGIAVGVWVSGSISGGHINPAVTLALATWRRFPWKKVPGYIAAQLLGGLVGAAIIYGNYFHAIDVFEGGRGVRTLSTAGMFGTYAADYMTSASCFFSEFLTTAMLLIGLLAITDKKNNVPAGLVPLALFVLVLGIASSLGMETGFAINPARDLGPRLLTSMVGYGRQVYTFRSQYWIWCPILAPILGAQFGTFIYDTFLFTGNESIMSNLFIDDTTSHTHDHSKLADNTANIV